MPTTKQEEFDYVADNGAKYKKVGKCEVCGLELFHCESHPIRDDRLDKTQVAVYVPNAMATGHGDEATATLYCLRHDPNLRMKMRRGLNPGEFMLGDIWEPLK